MQVSSTEYKKTYSRDLHNVPNLTIIAKTYKYYMTEGDYQQLLAYRKDYMGKKNIRDGSTEMTFIDDNNEITKGRSFSSSNGKIAKAKTTKKKGTK
jgi:hypothetical protein